MTPTKIDASRTHVSRREAFQLFSRAGVPNYAADKRWQWVHGSRSELTAEGKGIRFFWDLASPDKDDVSFTAPEGHDVWTFLAELRRKLALTMRAPASDDQKEIYAMWLALRCSLDGADPDPDAHEGELISYLLGFYWPFPRPGDEIIVDLLPGIVERAKSLVKGARIAS